MTADSYDDKFDAIGSGFAKKLADCIDKEVYAAYTTPTTTPGAIGSNYTGWTTGTGTGPVQYQYADTPVKMGSGILATDNTGGLSWNGYPIAPGERMKYSVRNLTEMLKDNTLKKIVLCKSKEECKEEFGKYGLEIYDSLLKDILEIAIKSEETFNNELQKEKDKTAKLRQYLVDNIPPEARHELTFDLMKS